MNNPLDLQTPIFSNSLKNFLKDDYSQFVSDFFQQYLHSSLVSEHNATRVYSFLYQKLKDGKIEKFNILNDIEKQEIEKYYVKLINDESNHFQFFENLYFDLFQKKLSNIELSIIEQNTIDDLFTESFPQSLFRFYIGECYLWVSFYSIYEDTNNENLKKGFYQLLVDESHHNASLYKISKKLLTSADFDEEFYFEQVKSHLYWMSALVDKKFNYYRNSPKLKEVVYNLVYNNNWHQNYRNTYLKKCYRLYKVFRPDVSLTEFVDSLTK